MNYKKTINPTVFSILKENGAIEFPCGMRLEGKNEEQVINLMFIDTFEIDKVFLLSPDGLNDAMKSMRDYENSRID